jgi:ArsR family transcriptional regulator
MDSLNYFKALSDSTRIRIFNILLDHELSVNELVSLMGMGQSRISRHLKILTDAGLLTCRRNGVWAFYSADRNPEMDAFNTAVRGVCHGESMIADDRAKAETLIRERNAKTRQFFNTIAHKWDSLKQEIMGDFDINAAIAGDIADADHAADLGCGTGELLWFLKDKARKVIGVDSSPRMLDEARKRFQGENGVVDLRLGELEHLPMKDGETDLSVISLALHHLSDPVAAVREAHRILKPSGTLVIAEFERHDNEFLRQHYGDRWLGLSQDDIMNWLDRSGFDLDRVKSHPLRQSLVLHIYTSKKRQ